jgi:hypothetical protein
MSSESAPASSDVPLAPVAGQPGAYRGQVERRWSARGGSRSGSNASRLVDVVVEAAHRHDVPLATSALAISFVDRICGFVGGHTDGSLVTVGAQRRRSGSCGHP